MAYNRNADLSVHYPYISFCNFLFYSQDIFSSGYELMDNRKGAPVTFISRLVYLFVVVVLFFFVFLYFL